MIKKLQCKFFGHNIVNLDGKDLYFCVRCGWANSIIKLIEYRMNQARLSFENALDANIRNSFYPPCEKKK